MTVLQGSGEGDERGEKKGVDRGMGRKGWKRKGSGVRTACRAFNRHEANDTQHTALSLTAVTLTRALMQVPPVPCDRTTQ